MKEFIRFSKKRSYGDDWAKVQYKRISKMSYSEIVQLLTRGLDNPIYSRNLTQEDTVLYAGGFGIWPIEQALKNINEQRVVESGSKTVSGFMVSKIIESDEEEDMVKMMEYWMYYIKFAGDVLFKELERGEAEEVNKLDRPTIVFNVKTGDKWICDWKHPALTTAGNEIAPSLKYHTGSSSVFDKSQIVILKPFEYQNFINWNSNPFEVKQ